MPGRGTGRGQRYVRRHHGEVGGLLLVQHSRVVAMFSKIDDRRFRDVLGHLPTGVVIITGKGDHGPVGLTVGTFTSVSLDPPLVGFFPAKSSTSWPPIERSGAFNANILGDHQEEVCLAFARKGGDKFAGVAWVPNDLGVPVLEGVVALLECAIESVTEAGDHLFVLGRVRRLTAGDEKLPLIFHRGRYRGLQH